LGIQSQVINRHCIHVMIGYGMEKRKNIIILPKLRIYYFTEVIVEYELFSVSGGMK
jgi:hypothetical protein